MASFEEQKAEIAAKYASAAQSQNHRLFRTAMRDHWRLVTEKDGPSDDLTQAMVRAGYPILGKPVTAATIDELVDLVSNVREDMTESQRLSVFMQDLLAGRELTPQNERARRRPAAATLNTRGSFSRGSRIDYNADDFDYVNVDFTPNRSISAAAQGIVAVIVLASLLGGLLYLLNQI